MSVNQIGKDGESIIQDFLDAHMDIRDRLIFYTVTGSRLRGLATEESDWDFIVVYYEDVKNYGQQHGRVKNVLYKDNHFMLLSIFQYLDALKDFKFIYWESLKYQNYLDVGEVISAYYDEDLFIKRCQYEIKTYRKNKRISDVKRDINIKRMDTVINQALSNGIQTLVGKYNDSKLSRDELKLKVLAKQVEDYKKQLEEMGING